ncbi:MAG: RNase adapter RapZ [Clostridia bacterium]|nr:RNase adapter RapZ [Clostridia bacterium]
MEFVVVTGMSGAGKSCAIDALEDIGFFCVDNLLPELIEPFYQLSKTSEKERIAVVTDVRGGSLFAGLNDTLRRMEEAGNDFRLIFLDADDEILLRRYKETRRKHPLLDMFGGSVEDAVKFEREILDTVKSRADSLIDTTNLSPQELKSRLISMFLNTAGGLLFTRVESFGFKYGAPREADLILDVRCLPNPYYIPELQEKTGLDREVSDYVYSFEESREVLRKYLDLIDYMLPLFVREGKSQLVIAIGCTGGHHRSVAFAEKIGEHLISGNWKVSVAHRDIRK